MRPFILLLLLLCFSKSASSQTGRVCGKVLSEDEVPVGYAQVLLNKTTFGSMTGEYGSFCVEKVEPGRYRLVVQMLGYSRHQQWVEVKPGEKLELPAIRLEAQALGLDEVVITGTQKPVYLSKSPVKVEVMTSKHIQRNISPVSLTQSIQLVNGLQEVVACGVCYTNSISINGLPGPYTAVLIDGMPIYGNLAATYGLNGIPTQIVDRLEIIKGPSSTLYGSEAVAGVINVITKDPRLQPVLQVETMGTSDLESFNNIALAPKAGKWSGYTGINHAFIHHFEDQNEDGFGDEANLDRVGLFTKWNLQRPEGRRFSLAARYYYEDRRNGVKSYLHDRAYRTLRGSDSIYGESIYTHRTELFGSWELPGRQNLRLDFSGSYHHQDSYYGADHYLAEQVTGFTNFLWPEQVGKHGLLLGATARYQYYDDNTAATENLGNPHSKNLPDRQYIPGVFVQDEWALHEHLTLLSGMRLDYYSHHGFIPAPRLNVKWKPAEWTTLRANFGSGFRIVNLFTEDHAFITGQRSVEIVEELHPERSWNGTLSLNHVFTLAKGQGTVDFDAFYTYFINKITPDYNQAGKIIYANSGGYAQSRGLGASFQYFFDFPLAFTLAATVQKVTQTEPDAQGQLETTPIEFAPQYSANGSVNYELEQAKLVFAYTMTLTGPMALPELHDLNPATGDPLPEPRPVRSPVFSLHNVQVTKALPKQRLEVFGGIQNLLNSLQPLSPLVGYNDPAFASGFSPWFDTSYSYGNLRGRKLYLGLRWNLERKENPNIDEN